MLAFVLTQARLAAGAAARRATHKGCAFCRVTIVCGQILTTATTTQVLTNVEEMLVPTALLMMLAMEEVMIVFFPVILIVTTPQLVRAVEAAVQLAPHTMAAMG